MCKEDIRIGRKKTTAVRQVTLDNVNPTLICGAARNRTHLCVGSASANWSMCPVPFRLDLSAGFSAIPGSHPFDFDVEIHGDVVCQPWHGLAVAGPMPITVMETFWEDDGQ